MWPVHASEGHHARLMLISKESKVTKNFKTPAPGQCSQKFMYGLEGLVLFPLNISSLQSHERCDRQNLLRQTATTGVPRS